MIREARVGEVEFGMACKRLGSEAGLWGCTKDAIGLMRHLLYFARLLKS
jgi:hypothetical protein